MVCPECGGECEQDMVDVGVGSIASGPMGCPDCHWVDASDDIPNDDLSCVNCNGSGELPHDCGEDACCCIDTDGDMCPVCNGMG